LIFCEVATMIFNSERQVQQWKHVKKNNLNYFATTVSLGSVTRHKALTAFLLGSTTVLIKKWDFIRWYLQGPA